MMLALGSGCKYRLSLAERFDFTETIVNQLLADSYQNPISEWQVRTSSGLPVILHYGELYHYFIIYYNVIIIEIKCTINVMHLNHPETCPPPPPPPLSVEKLSSTKPVPGAKNVGDRCSIRLQFLKCFYAFWKSGLMKMHWNKFRGLDQGPNHIPILCPDLSFQNFSPTSFSLLSSYNLSGILFT